MKKIVCSNYGYDCKFEITDNDLEFIEKYQKHCMDEHGVEHSIEGLTQLILRIKN
jgi:predicted small metal-binding protein